MTSSTPASAAFGELERAAPVPLSVAVSVSEPMRTEAGAGLRPDGAWTALLDASGRFGGWRVAYCVVFKRWFDVVLATLALLALAPILALAALVVRLDSPGPIVFRQRRIGRGGQPFVMYKFRTMVVDPGGDLHLFRDREGRFRHKIADDPRVTRSGRFLRRTSIDELPQLLNVLRREMSLVGPRPELPQIVQTYEPWQHRRHVVRPGITGWWQTSGRSESVMHEHTELDLYYVDNLSFALDARIVLVTTKTVLSGIGAF